MGRAGRRRWLGSFGLAVLSAGSQAHAQSRLIDDSLRSPALEANLLGDSPTRHILIYLPPSYALNDGQRYPAVYLLHGFSGTPAVWTSGHYAGLRIQAVMDSLIAAAAIREFVVVMPDGSTDLGGSAFTNSTTTGRWETYLIRDVVRFIEARYRTIRRGSSRGIAGHSMGAAAALRVAMRFPGIFGAAYAMSPNASLPCETLSVEEADTLLRLTRRSQRDSIGFWPQVCLGYAADWSPDSARAPFFADLPFTRDHDRVVPDTAVLERWQAWRLLDMAPRYREGLVRLRGIALDVGNADPYGPGVARLDSLLTHLRVRHSFEFYAGDHSSGIHDRVTAHLLPWFSSVLDFGPEGM
jgi:pimeloyl-ACP methyl ester carboxylesterase